MTQPAPRYEVVNQRTGERFGNHTQVEAISRAYVMARNHQYRDQFKAVEIQEAKCE